jgi:hypothetical protein
MPLTQVVVLTEDWDDVSGGDSAVLMTHEGGYSVEYCTAANAADADEVDRGHVLSAKHGPVLWESSAAGQRLFVRTSTADAGSVNQPEIVVTIYP